MFHFTSLRHLRHLHIGLDIWLLFIHVPGTFPISLIFTDGFQYSITSHRPLHICNLHPFTVLLYFTYTSAKLALYIGDVFFESIWHMTSAVSAFAARGYCLGGHLNYSESSNFAKAQICLSLPVAVALGSESPKPQETEGRRLLPLTFNFNHPSK